MIRLAAVLVVAFLVATPTGRAAAAGLLGDRAPVAAGGAPRDPGSVANPVPGSCVSSGWGKRWGSWHYGTDFAAPLGTPIRAVAAGRVTYSGPARGYGQMIRVRHAGGTVTEYGHMRRRDVAAGEQVRAGDVIARVGEEGQSTGPHLHLRVYPAGELDGKGTNPRPWLARRGVAVASCR